MIKEQILCKKCRNLIDITDMVCEYGSYEEEETIGTIECEECGTSHDISYTLSVDFEGK